MSLKTERLLQNRYQIVRAIKEGGQGAVYEAVDQKLADSPCAVKEILENVHGGEDSEYMQERFFQEMKALVALDHPCIPKVRDYVKLDTTIYIVMDLVRGRNLQQECIEAMLQSGAPPSLEQTARDMLLVLDTLTYLHEQAPPLIHRDIKPANILRDDRNGQIKLVDFGLARSLEAPTTPQTIVGTLGYCSPEQLRGRAEPASDVYSTGVTMHHLLTGQAPDSVYFEALRPALAAEYEGLAAIVEKATQPKVALRYASAQEMADSLRAWLLQLQTSPAPAPVLSKRNSPRAMRWGTMAAALTMGLFLGRESFRPAPASSISQPSIISIAAPPAIILPTPAKPRPANPRPIQQAQVLPPQPRRAPAPASAPPKPPQRAPVLPRVDVGSSYPTYHGPPIVAKAPVTNTTVAINSPEPATVRPVQTAPADPRLSLEQARRRLHRLQNYLAHENQSAHSKNLRGLHISEF